MQIKLRIMNYELIINYTFSREGVLVMKMIASSIFKRVFWGLFICMLLTGNAFAAMSNRSFIALCWKGTLK